MSTPLRVAHLLSGDLWAGAEAATFQLIRALSRRGEVSVRAIVLNEGVLAQRLAGLGVPVRVLPEAALSLRELLRDVRREVAGCDLVHAHRVKEDWLASHSGVPWITTRHGRPERFEGVRALRAAALQTLDLWTIRRGARRVVAVSPELGAWLARRVPRSRIDVIPNGLRDPWPSGPPAWPGRPLRAGVLARLTPVKAVHLALESVARIPDLALDVVGDGPEAERLRRRARELRLGDRVQFVGFDPDPACRIASWRVLVVTSEHEGHPMSVLEAMAAGTPVATVPLRGLVETIGGGGRAAASRAPRDLARTLRDLLEERTGRRASREARARFLERFTDDRCAAATTASYRSALRGGPRSVGGGRFARRRKERCSGTQRERMAGGAVRRGW